MTLNDVMQRDAGFGVLPEHYQGQRDRRYLLALLLVPALIAVGRS